MDLVERPHGIMFHHFYDNNVHIKGQGAISQEDLEDLISFYSLNHNIIDSDVFFKKAITNSLAPNDVCLTFDDGLKCQYDIAFPVLKKKGIKAFWFIYSAPLVGILEKLEVFRHFRTVCFSSIDAFYDAFFDETEKMYDIKSQMDRFNPEEYLSNSPFYSVNDKKFRYIRDVVLKEKKYNEIMETLMHEHDYTPIMFKDRLWMTEEDIANLFADHQSIGMHSFSHPTRIVDKGYIGQYEEYSKGKTILEQITNSPIDTVSYPCGQYDQDTMKVMRELGVKIGFNAFMIGPRLSCDVMEIPRQDHANIMRMMSNGY